jgi:hypothetical protein
MLIKSSINHHDVGDSLDSVVNIAFRLKAEWPGVRISVKQKLFCSPKNSRKSLGPRLYPIQLVTGFFSGVMAAGT